MATNNDRFTDQPQMESTVARYDDDYFNGCDDAKAGNPRDEEGTSQYHKGYSDTLKEMPNKK